MKMVDLMYFTVGLTLICLIFVALNDYGALVTTTTSIIFLCLFLFLFYKFCVHIGALVVSFLMVAV